jgi:hypothetical protein
MAGEIPGVHSSPLLTLSGPAPLGWPLGAGGRTLPSSSAPPIVPSVSDLAVHAGMGDGPPPSRVRPPAAEHGDIERGFRWYVRRTDAR